MWWLWLVVALAAAIAEIAASGLVFGGVAGAALAAAIVAVFVPAILPEAIVFAAVSVIYLIALRPTALRFLTEHSRPLLGSGGTSTLVGRHAVVTEEVTAHGGQVRLGKGEFWSARSYDGKDVIAVGTTIEIAYVEGLTALVWRVAE